MIDVATRAFAFEDVAVVPMDAGDRILPGQVVVVREGRIASMGAAGTVPIPPEALRIPGRGRYLLPGLADMHTHIRGEWDLLLLVAYGVTTVRNMWGMPRHLALRDRILRGDLLGPTIYTTGPPVDGKLTTMNWIEVIDSMSEAERSVADTVGAGYDAGIKVLNYLSPDVYGALVRAARSRGT